MNKPLQSGAYPSSKEEAAKAKKNLISFIHSDNVQNRIAQQLQQSQDPQQLGQLVGFMVGRVLQAIRTQQQRKPHIKLVLNLIRTAIMQFVKIGKVIGVEIPEESHKQIAEVAGGVVEQMAKQGKQPQGQPQQPQGQPMQPQTQGQPMQQPQPGLLEGM
jgi:glycyl-tRNA synthetase beta subunit